jgi:hypothetical protein
LGLQERSDMRFQFDPDLDFQNQAIDAAVRLFEGAPDPKGVTFRFVVICSIM